MKTVLFDLDGTLLPMDLDEFVSYYFGLLAKKMRPRGYEERRLISAIWAGTAAMAKNDGSRSNEAAFWRTFTDSYGEVPAEDRALFEEFYAVEFQQARALCGFNPKAAETVRLVRELGLRAALATNPLFPAVATESRIRWAGLEPSDFELYTTYENIGYCKPNPEYYREILRRMDAAPAETLMVGNDADEDLAAEDAGISVFLLTDCLINRHSRDISAYPRGGFDELQTFLRKGGK